MVQWTNCGSLNIAGYNVYRTYGSIIDYPDLPLNGTAVIDSCFFIDSTVFPGKSYSYGIAAVASDGSTGKKSAPQKVMTTTSYSVDTLPKPAGMTPVCVYWINNEQPLAVYQQNNNIKIVEYNPDHSILHQSDIALSFFCRMAVVDNGRVYVVRHEQGMDSSEVYCYYLDGTFGYTCVIDCEIYMLDVRNDTLFVFENMRKTLPVNITNAYDNTGKLIFTMKKDQRPEDCTFFRHTTDGNFYTTNWIFNEMGAEIEALSIIKHDFATSQETPYIIKANMKMSFLIDAYNDLFIIQSAMNINSDGGVIIVNSHGDVLYDFKQKLFNVLTHSGAINSHGRILAIKADTVLLMTLPLNVGE
jgi:hypothetical protein